MKMRKIFICMLVMLFCVSNICCMKVNATDTGDIIDAMQNANIGVSSGSNTTGVFGGINTIIGILQVAGTGIAVIVVTMLGIKYILASVEEKAEIKKQAVPIVIGCVLLFGAVTLISTIENIAPNLLQASSVPKVKTGTM